MATPAEKPLASIVNSLDLQTNVKVPPAAKGLLAGLTNAFRQPATILPLVAAARERAAWPAFSLE